MLGFIPKLRKYENLIDVVFRVYLYEKDEQSKKTVTLENLEKIFRKHFKMEVKERSAASRMESLHASYASILRRNGFKWVVERNTNRLG